MRVREREDMEGGCLINGSGRQLSRTTRPVSKQFEVGDKTKHSNGVSFIKVLGRDFSKQLQIPEEYTANFNGSMPHRFIIESSIPKKCWRVEVEEDGDGKVYFRQGWGDFVEAHLLEVGNFLLFEYAEQSIFQVKIYGRNGCEKTTAVDPILGGAHKLGKAIVIEDDGKSGAFDIEQKNLKKHHEQKTRKLSLKKYEGGIDKKRHGRVSSNKREQRWATKVSISENSVCFSVAMHKRKKHQFYQVTVPMAVSSQKNLSSKEKITLQDEKGNCWTVKLLHRGNGCVIFARGWKDFLNGNEIGSGDILRLEFISDDLIQVHVTRALKKVEHHGEEAKPQNEASGSSLNMDCEQDEPVNCSDNKATEASIIRKQVSSHDISSSSFSFMWRTNTYGAYLYIPKAVAVGQNMKNKDSMVLRDPEGKCWPLEVRRWSDGRVALTKGWSEFWQGHGITAGDSLTFEFVSEFLIQVTINRGRSLVNAIEETVIDSKEEIDDEGDATQLELAVDNAGPLDIE